MTTPRNYSELVVLIHSGPDSHGRYIHTRLWLSDYNPNFGDGTRVQGQVFRSELPRKTDRWPIVTYIGLGLRGEEAAS